MYFLLAKDGTKAFYLFESREYILGRKECDILIKDDSSISRKHASLAIKNGKLWITDLGARYNTFVNSIQLIPGFLTELKVNDEIIFGILNSVYRVKEQKLNVTTSGLTPEEKKILSRTIKRLDGNVSLHWSKECSYLIVREIILTLKVLCALIEKQPIVTLEFWTDYVKNVNENLPPPNPADYKAAYAENVMNKNINFTEECCRKNLFQNKVFIFKNKISKAKIEVVVELAGGTCFYWNEKPLTKDHFSSNNPQYLLIQDDIKNSLGNDSFMKMIDYLHSIRKRSIPFQEIAMAVVVGSCEKDCNPDFDRTGTLIQQREQIIFTNDILAPETQTQDLADVKPSVVVPETARDIFMIEEELTDKKKGESQTNGNKREAQELGNDNKRARLGNTENKETYSNIFGTQHQQNIITSTQERIHNEIDVKAFNSPISVPENIKEFNANNTQLGSEESSKSTNKNDANLKRIHQEINSDEKRIRLEDDTKADGWGAVPRHKTNRSGKPVSIDLTLEDNEIVTSTQKKRTSTPSTSRLDHDKKSVNPFGFVRCATNPKTTAKISDFFNPISISNANQPDISVIDLESPSTSGKRKSSDDGSPSKINKKQLLLRNPFSKSTESEKNDNPFQRRISIKEGSLKNNPFLPLIKSEESKKEESIKCIEETVVPYICNVTIVNAEIEKDHGWLPKSNITKDDNSCNDGVGMESFNNCAIIDKLLVVERSLIDYYKEISGNGKKDLGKFKKIQVLHMQTTIIPRSRYIDTTGIETTVN